MTRRRSGRVIGGAIAALTLSLALGAGPAAAQSCVGDCRERGEVGVSDIILAVNIVLGLAPADACPALGPPPIGIAQVIASIANALCACQPCPTPPPTSTATATRPPTATPTASPTPTAIASYWFEDRVRIASSTCPRDLNTALREELEPSTDHYTVRGTGGAVELIADSGGIIPGATLDDQQVLRATVVQRESEGACTVTLSLALQVDLSRSPSTAMYDAQLGTQSCPRTINCRLTITSRWTRTEPAALRRAAPSPWRALLRAAH